MWVSITELQQAHDAAKLDKLRAEKKRLDEQNSPAAILGCVGEPIAAWLVLAEQHLPGDLLDMIPEVCQAARNNLLGYVNESLQGAYDQGVNDIGDYLSCVEFEFDADCFDIGTVTLGEIAETGWDACVELISGWCGEHPGCNDEDL